MTRRRWPLAVLVVLLSAAPARGQVGDVAGVHDPCIIRQGETFYLFCTGPGVPIRTSKDLYHWTRAGDVFAALPEWVKRDVPGATWAWAPDISRLDGEYRLYYSVSTFGSRRSCVGLMTNRTLDPADPAYRWVDRGKVIETRESDDWNAIDPAVFLDSRGRPWMALGSFWSGIKLVRLDLKAGKPPADAPVEPIAARPGEHAIEAPFVTRRRGYSYLWASFDHCCRGADSTYRIVVGRSRAVGGPYLDREGKRLLDGGGTAVLSGAGDVRGPGHCAVIAVGGTDYLVHHYYDAAHHGRKTLQIRPLAWDADGWPTPGPPLAGPVAAD